LEIELKIELWLPEVAMSLLHTEPLSPHHPVVNQTAYNFLPVLALVQVHCNLLRIGHNDLELNWNITWK